MKFTINVLSLTIILVNSDKSFNEFSLKINNLFQVLIEQIDVYQVLWIIEDEKSINYHIIKSIIAENSILYPTKVFNYEKLLSKKRIDSSELQSIIDFKKCAILFIAILDSSKVSNKEKMTLIKILQTISVQSESSKFLLFIINEGNEKMFDSSLKHAWEMKMVDVTIFEIIVEHISIANISSSRYRLHNELDNLKLTDNIHQFNPFTNKYTKTLYGPKISLFPNKLINLHKYELLIGHVHQPPYSHAERNADGNEVIGGVDGELIKTIARNMNFTMISRVRNMSHYGVVKDDGSATGLLGDVVKGEIDAIAFSAFLFGTSLNKKVDRTCYLRVEQYCALVPLIPMTRVLTGHDFYIAIAMAAVIIVFICLFGSIVLSNERGLWHPLNIAFVILGVGVHVDPKVIQERSIYGSCFVLSLFYSSTVFAQLTSFNVDTHSFEPFNSFEELNDSGLVPVINPNGRKTTFGHSDGVLQSLGEKSMPLPTADEECHTWLMNYQNVTCITPDIRANFLTHIYKDSNGDQRMKIAQPKLLTAARSYILAKASPFTERFDQIIMRVLQSGIEARWWEDYYVFYSKGNNITATAVDDVGKSLADELTDTTYKQDLYTISAIGYLVSFCIFLGEIGFYKIKLKYQFSCHFNFFRQFGLADSKIL